MTPFYGWGSTAARLQPYEEAVYFITLSSQRLLVLILSIDLGEMKGWVDLGDIQ